MSCRRDYRDLSGAERGRFIAALYHVKSRGVVDAFADLHRIHFDHGHRNSSFLPWHREFLRLFELELQTYDARVTIPYWNSSTDQSVTSSLWSNAFLGQFDGAWSLGRSIGAGGWLPSVAAVDSALGHAQYPQMWPDLEGNVHNGPHPWVGGLMGGASSPHDPVFFLHHCFIDMCWAQWQLRHPAAPFVASPGAPSLNDHMHPWSTTVADVLDHRSINMYAYPPSWMQDAPRVSPPPAAPPTVSFSVVPVGLTFVRPAKFEIDACLPLTFTVADPVVDSGPPGTAFTRLGAASQAFDPHVDEAVQIWFSFRGTAANTGATGHVDIDCLETGDTWRVPITADVIALPRSAMALVLDQSNSMTFDSGLAPGISRADILRFSAPPAVEVLDEDHAMLITTFDHDAHARIGLTAADATGRFQLNGTISGYAPNPNGWTAIGEALQSAHDQLAPVTGYDVKATVLLTDGRENHGPHARRSIADVAALVTERCYAIGLGTPSQIDPAALISLCQGHDGYMLLTGALDQNAYFRLAKYYQQIIAGVTNHDIVVDPEGVLSPGQTIRIPFWLSETDILARAVLLTTNPRSLLFGLETPAGDLISATTSHPMIEFRTGQAVQMYRLGLPLPFQGTEVHAGQWHAVLFGGWQQVGTHALAASNPALARARYSLNIQAISNLKMRATLAQSGYEPGAALYLRTSLTEYGLPLTTSASVRADVESPDGTSSTITLSSVGGGVYQADLIASMEGVHRIDVVAEGATSRGRPFTREQLLTGAVWSGGDRPSDPPGSKPDLSDPICELFACLLRRPGISSLLERHRIDPHEVSKCLDEACSKRDSGHGVGPV